MKGWMERQMDSVMEGQKHGCMDTSRSSLLALPSHFHHLQLPCVQLHTHPWLLNIQKLSAGWPLGMLS